MKKESNVTRVGVAGAGGRIGKELFNLIHQHPGFEASLGIGHNANGFLIQALKFDQTLSSHLDVLIDFSSPELFEDSLAFCKNYKIPFVSGTTGLAPHHHDQMQAAGAFIPILWSPNMSLGIALLKRAMSLFKSTAHFDFQLEEWHHRYKKDHPSGTALFLQAELEKVVNKQCPPPLVMRAGGIFGVHKVYAVSDEEIISFEHTALNRTVFAKGALVGASWLLAQAKNGVYSMDDVIS